MANNFDIIVIGAGIAGASVAAHLAETKRVLILEMEDRPAFTQRGARLPPLSQITARRPFWLSLAPAMTFS
jgi:D-arginine dehydrogenase